MHFDGPFSIRKDLRQTFVGEHKMIACQFSELVRENQINLKIHRGHVLTYSPYSIFKITLEVVVTKAVMRHM